MERGEGWWARGLKKGKRREAFLKDFSAESRGGGSPILPLKRDGARRHLGDSSAFLAADFLWRVSAIARRQRPA